MPMLEHDGITLSVTFFHCSLLYAQVSFKQVLQFNSVASALIAGALAGAMAKTAIAPFDRAKIHFQVSSTKQYSMKAALGFLKNVYRERGFFALYRGNSAMMARVMPFSAIQFAAFEEFKLLLHVDENGIKTPYRRFLSGTLAAMVSTCITYPLDTARARFAANDEYANLRSVFAKGYKTSGILGFYKGIKPTLYGMIPYAGVSFFTISTLRLWYKENSGNTVGPLQNFVFGAMAGVSGQVLSYPFDIVRRRMQTGELSSDKKVSHAIYEIIKSEGIVRGIFKGLSMNWVKGPISTGIVFASYDIINGSVRAFLDSRKQE